MELTTIKRDPAVAEAGTWVRDIPGMGDLELKVRGMSSTAFQGEFGRLSRAVPKGDRQRDGSINPDIAAKVMGQALHASVLLDWRGLYQGRKPLPYDAGVALELLTDPAWRTFADAVVWASSIVDGTKAEEADTLAKNSKPSSAGN